MKKSDSRSSRGGFTLIEVVVSTALLAVVCTGFLMMTAANAGQMSREQRLEQSNYNLSARAGQGEETLPGKPLRWSSAWRGRTRSGKYLNNMKSPNRGKMPATI